MLTDLNKFDIDFLVRQLERPPQLEDTLVLTYTSEYVPLKLSLKKAIEEYYVDRE